MAGLGGPGPEAGGAGRVGASPVLRLLRPPRLRSPPYEAGPCLACSVLPRLEALRPEPGLIMVWTRLGGGKKKKDSILNNLQMCLCLCVHVSASTERIQKRALCP